MPFNLTTFDTALQAKLNTASVSMSAQEYLLLTKALAAAIEISEGINLIDLKGTANGIAGLDGTGNVPISQLLNAIPAQGSNGGKFLTTNGTSTSWAVVDAFPSQTGNSGKILTTNGTSTSWTATPSLTTVTTSGDVTVGDDLYVGSGAAAFETSATLTDAAVVINTDGGANSFAQVAFRNAEPTSSTDIIAYMDNGTDSEGWVGMGIAGSQFDDSTYGITNPGDGYIFHNTKTGNSRTGNLVIATGDAGTENKIIIAAGGFASGDTQMAITPADTGVSGNVHIEINTPSTSATTGALTVVGGVGIQGDMNIQGDVAIQGTITFGGGGTTVETANLAVTDPAVFVGTNNQADIVDLAFIGEYATTVSPIVSTVNNKALTNNVATLTTASSHTYLAGDVVTITGVDATFNGTFNIIAVPTSTTFTYAKTASNVTSAAVSPTGTATVNARRKFAGIARDASDAVIKIFKDATTKPVSTVNFSEAGLGYADLKIGGLVADSITVGNVSNTEIGYLDGVTSAIQTQLNAKLDTSTASSTYLTQTDASTTYLTQTNASSTYLTQSNASTTYAPKASPTFTGIVTLPSDTAIGTVSATEIGYLDGVTSSVQTQLNAKLSTTTAASTYAPLLQTTSTPTFSSNSYTLVAGDADKILLASNGSTAANVVVPAGVFNVGQVITIVQTGTGQLTLQQSATTINSNGSKYKLNGQFATCQLICTAANTFLVIGNMVA
jgi:hypothetical protein